MFASLWTIDGLDHKESNLTIIAYLNAQDVVAVRQLFFCCYFDGC